MLEGRASLGLLTAVLQARPQRENTKPVRTVQCSIGFVNKLDFVKLPKVIKV